MNLKNKICSLATLLFTCIFYAYPTTGIAMDSLSDIDTSNFINDEQKDSLNIQVVDSLTSYQDSTLSNSDWLIKRDETIVKEAVEQKGSNKKDKKQKPTPEINPESYHARQAAKWAILPGGGQIYNKKWWKVPIAWAMIGAGGYFIYNSASNMRTYNIALDMRNSGLPDQFQGTLSEQQIITYRNHYRRNLQLSAFGTVGLWTLTILDAVVDAHLKTYNISDDLSIKFKPKVLRVDNNSVPSLTITLFL